MKSKDVLVNVAFSLDGIVVCADCKKQVFKPSDAQWQGDKLVHITCPYSSWPGSLK